ncbi:MAG: tRNA (adenosine(37)-N6)-threonylcarbamoyltransferase complex dimerization subunit type 1 TsaB [Ruminococcus sp.]|uniref:tRNA (adenosine(37)-N6)-threonylcarbamoyltransferase complex dimerization subunit type 1 TsaB n=1 Tax=Ruminococcus sp. TaxID=41978 RepID=UPI001B72A31A|nr:tRNA (adenosine(37)-N6)-threonylcarbamoyltransferase complex dimerization subunit type 1 TsaB [Ruminococcus sp.]MBP5579786.1 tRNA (adenosine(37)-N6)-threonylcarbamoyltransferase complex dimerization subunit type 1 TsaB [Ruminococcus sp.]
MLLLGIDTSGKTASAALFDSDKELFLAQSTVYTQKTHSQVIMPMVKDVMAQAGKELSDLGGIAAANGPGSYTGLRIGVAAVKALSFGLGVKCCGVSTLLGLACNNLAYKGHICAIMKARGELVYTCTYKSDGYCVEQVTEEQIISQDELAEFLALNVKEAMLCGDGAADFYNTYASPAFIIAPPQGRLQSAAGVCLAGISKKLSEPGQLEVSYLQKVKAEKDLDNKKL